MKKLLFTSSFLVLASVAASSSAQVAQDATTTAVPPQQNENPSAVDVATDATTPAGESATVPPAQGAVPAQAAGVEDIVVTAQRRRERQQDVPIAISTVTAAAAARQGVSGTESLGIAVPSLQFTRQTGNGGAPYLRGVGAQQVSNGAEAPVATYVDDVYYAAPASNILQFNNIDSVEVLKGPQGTLFGRNATGGVVHIHTRRPSQDPSLDFLAGFGSYDTYYGSLYATGPITDTIAVNLAMQGQKQEKGYGHNLITGEDTLKGWNYGFRSQLLWEPSDATSLLLSGDYTKRDGDEGMSVHIRPGTLGSRGPAGAGGVAGGFVDWFGTYDQGDHSPGYNWGLSGKFNHDFGPVNFVSISAYRYSTYCLILDVDGTAGQNIQKIGCVKRPFTKTFSQEFQLLSSGEGPLKWILGGFYYDSEANSGRSLSEGTGVTGGRQVGIISITDLKSYAAFADATYEFLPNTRLTGGLRYTTDKRNRDTPASKAKESKLTYRAVLDHKLTPDVMLYASYSTGFKSGGFNGIIRLPTGESFIPDPFKPEVLTAYEGGVKSELFGRKARLNVSVFHYKYDNLQVSQIVSGNAIIRNAASARMNGVDIDWNFVPNRYLNIGGAFSYLDSKFTRFPGGPRFVPNPANCTLGTTTGPITGGNTNCPTDLAGNRTPRAPKFTFSLNATLTVPTNMGDLVFNASLYHNDGFFWEPDNRYRQPKYDLVNSTISWFSPDRKFEVRVYGKNLLDERYHSYASEGPLRDAASPAAPRTFGAAFAMHL